MKARIGSVGGQSPVYYIGVAAALGYTITIDEFAPVKFGTTRFGSPWYGAAWKYVWRVNVSNAAKFPAKFGSARFGDPWTSYSGQQLTCVLNRLEPSHTILIMNYEGTA